MRKVWPDRRVLFCCLLLATLAPPARGESAAFRTPISASQVAKALEAAGWSVTAGQVKFLVQVRSDGAEPDLQVMRVSKWMKDSAKAKLRCRDRHACLPFYVVVEGIRQVRHTPAYSAPQNTSGAMVFDTVSRPPLMRGGDRATLIFADHALRITIPVICLQSGNRGQTIRVASEDHRRFFKGEIIGPGLLRAARL